MSAAVDLSDIVANYAEEIASAMAVYHASPELRDEMIARAETLLDRLNYAMLSLSLKHKAEAFEAKL
jgi:hypothetical protein